MFQDSLKEGPKGGIRVSLWKGEDCYVAGGGPEDIDILPDQCQDFGPIKLKAHCLNGQAYVQTFKKPDCSDDPTPYSVPAEKMCNKDFLGLYKSFAYECL